MCVLREVLVAWTVVNLLVFAGEMEVTQVNCVWSLFTCSSQVKLLAFAGSFEGASFKVYICSRNGLQPDVQLTILLP